MGVAIRGDDIEDATGLVIEYCSATTGRIVDFKVRQGSGIRCQGHRTVVVPDATAAQRNRIGKTRCQSRGHPGLRRQRPRAGNGAVGPIETAAGRHIQVADAV